MAASRQRAIIAVVQLHCGKRLLLLRAAMYTWHILHDTGHEVRLTTAWQLTVRIAASQVAQRKGTIPAAGEINTQAARDSRPLQMRRAPSGSEI
jgi:hypothetical protein